MDTRTPISHDIAYLSDLKVTQDGEYVKIANDLDTNLRALDTAIQSGGGGGGDVSGKADKVANATEGNFAGLDNTGNLTDSGKKSADFATAAQGALADTALQPGDVASTYASDGTAPVNGTAVAAALGGLDAEVTSNDGTNVQVKVTQTDGVVTAVNVTTDNTYAKPAGGIPGSDIADGAITASKLAGLHGIVLIDDAEEGTYVGKQYRLSILNGRLSIEEIEDESGGGDDVPSGLPTWDKDTTLPQMKSYWKFDVTANANDGDSSTNRTNTALIGQ